MKKLDIETIAKYYIIAALWADCPESTHPRATKEAKKQAYETCEKFVALIDDLIPDILACTKYWAHPDCDGKPEAAIGHDLYLTSAGHGVGFWSRDELGDELGKKLTSFCGWRKAIPEPTVYFYRGWMYL